MNSARTSPRLVDWVIFVVLLVGALLMCGPFIWMISTSLKPSAEVFRFPPTLLSAHPQPANYGRIFSTIPFGQALTNSVIVATSVTLLQLIVCSMAAYAFACLRFRGREVLFLIYLAALMVPSQVTLIPNFILIRNLGWIDTYQGLILPYAFSSFGTFLLRQYMKTIPIELIEAARIDGASTAQIAWRIQLPLLRKWISYMGIMSLAAGTQLFVEPELLSQASNAIVPNDYSLNQLAYQYAFQQNDFNGAAAISLLLLVVALALSAVFVTRGGLFETD